jgi:ATP-binding cassette, subfamily B, bacterial
LEYTLKQLLSQKDIRLGLIKSREEIDGTLVEQPSGIDYIRAAGTHEREIMRIAQHTEQLRKKEMRHPFPNVAFWIC